MLTNADIIDIVRRETPEQLAARLRYRRPPGECPTCDALRNDRMMPSHTAREGCESGKRPHCTCDVCF